MTTSRHHLALEHLRQCLVWETGCPDDSVVADDALWECRVRDEDNGHAGRGYWLALVYIYRPLVHA